MIVGLAIAWRGTLWFSAKNTSIIVYQVIFTPLIYFLKSFFFWRVQIICIKFALSCNAWWFESWVCSSFRPMNQEKTSNLLSWTKKKIIWCYYVFAYYTPHYILVCWLLYNHVLWLRSTEHCTHVCSNARSHFEKSRIINILQIRVLSVDPSVCTRIMELPEMRDGLPSRQKWWANQGGPGANQSLRVNYENFNLSYWINIQEVWGVE